MGVFKESVIKYVSAIPKGNVASYGQIALYAGYPRGARQVGWILNKLPENTNVPWWRVINNKGYISIKAHSTYDAEIQKVLLEKEGVIIDKAYNIDINKYRYNPEIIIKS